MSIAQENSRLVGLDLVSKVAAGLAGRISGDEAIKGCDPTLFLEAVDLEPPLDDTVGACNPNFGMAQPVSRRFTPRLIADPVVVKVWCPEDNGLEWQQFNDLHKELNVLCHPIAFEVAGNATGIWIQMVVDRHDLPSVLTAANAEFPDVRLENVENDGLLPWLASSSLQLELEDYFPHPPYYRNMTVHENIGGSPLAPIYIALSRLPETEFAFYRVISVPAAHHHDWHQRINAFTDLEYRGTNEDFYNPAIPHAYHQVPSMYLPLASERQEQKAHPDRPPEPKPRPEGDVVRQIIEYSRRHYYVRRAESTVPERPDNPIQPKPRVFETFSDTN